MSPFLFCNSGSCFSNVFLNSSGRVLLLLIFDMEKNVYLQLIGLFLNYMCSYPQIVAFQDYKKCILQKTLFRV